MADLGGNSEENRAYVPELQERYGWYDVLDVGAGRGYYGELLAGPDVVVTGVDTWAPAVEHIDASGNYDLAVVCHGRRWLQLALQNADRYQVVVLGDVLEHMPVQEALIVFELARAVADHVLVSFPIVPFPQDALYGNEHERHVIEDPATELLPHMGTPIEEQRYTYTGTFVYAGFQSGKL